MIYTHDDKSKLPTITETVSILRNIVNQLPKVQLMPYDIPTDKDFILTRTNMAYSIKPNIQRHSVLFMGVPHPKPMLHGDWWNIKRNEYMIQNVLQEEIRIVMESHPMYRLFRDGFAGIRIYNPYGIGMAYGLPTATLPLTSDIEIASFFATHKIDPVTGEYKLCNGDGGKTGILYLFELAMPMPYIPGLSTVGKQPFIRSGRMKMFAYDTNPSMDFSGLPFVKGFEFRHDVSETRSLCQRFYESDSALFPNELFAEKVKRILTGKKVSKLAVERNLQSNPNDNREVNIKRLNDAGFEIVESLDLIFSDDELNGIWYDGVERKWAEFWNDIAFCNVKRRVAQEILDLPNNEQYRKYFV